jgi:hypothetical protein
MDKVKFQPNIPEQVTLRHSSGKIVDGRFGEQVYYSLADGRCMYLDLGVAQKLNVLEVQAGESLNICKRGGGIWDVWLSPETEKMRAARDVGSVEERLRASVGQACETRYATLKVPTPINTGASVTAPAPAQGTAVSSSHQNTGNVSTDALVDEANILVDAFAEVLDRALTTYQGRIKPDDVRSLLLSAYITKSKGAKYAAA